MTTSHSDLAAMVRGILAEVRAGNLFAIGVLADYLEDVRHPAAARVRNLYCRWDDRRRYWLAHDFTRSRKWCRRSVLEADAKHLVEHFVPIARAILRADRA